MEYSQRTEFVRKNYFINILLISLYSILSITPVNHIVGIDKVAFFISLLWFFHTLSINTTILKSPSFKLWMLFYLWQVIMIVIGNSSVSLFRVLIRFNFFILPVMGLFVVKYYNSKELQFLFKFLFSLLFLTLCVNCLIGILNPRAFDEDSGLAGTGMIATFLIFAGICIYVYRHSRLKYRRLLSISAAALFVFFVTVVNARGIAFLLFLLMIFLFYLSQYKGNKFSLLLIVVGVIVIGVNLLVPILEYISSMSGVSERLVEKFSEIINIASEKQLDTDIYEAQGSMEVRLALSGLSLQTWTANTHNFLIGCGEHYIDASELSDIIRAGVGCHSEFIDVLAKYGVIGAIILYTALYSSFSEISKIVGVRSKFSEMACIYAIFIIYSCLNISLFSSMLMVVFICLPISVKLIPNNA